MNDYKILGVIPARYASSRFPGKPLVELLGKPMIIWVAELTAKALGKENVIIATENEQIVDVVEGYGYNAIMTPNNMPTGTDRVAYVASKVQADIYINIQGDEPTLEPSNILKVIEAKKKNFDYVINCFSAINSSESEENVNIPKVLVSSKDEMIYMSRLPIPGFKDESKKVESYYKQVCIYGFNNAELESYFNYGKKSEFEKSEDIEILRFIDLGIPVKMVYVEEESYAVDVPSDVPKVESKLRESNEN